MFKGNPKPSQRREGRNPNPPTFKKEDTTQKPQTETGKRFVALEGSTKEANLVEEAIVREEALVRASSPKNLSAEGKGSPDKTLGKHTPQTQEATTQREP